MYLFSHGESNRNNMLHNQDYGLSRLERGRLTILLEKMKDSGWVKKFESIVYNLENKGKQMAEAIKKLKDENDSHPFFDLETFVGIRVLGLAND